MKILLPKAEFIRQSRTPLFFLAGPVRGGGDWQATCCQELRLLLDDFYAALPCRYDQTHWLTEFMAQKTERTFARQLDWETHYLADASRSGGIIFWLPCESKDKPREGDEPYAMETRRELGEWMGRMIHEKNIRITVGAEPAFPGLSQIERNFKRVAGPDFQIYSSLEETATAAINKIG